MEEQTRAPRRSRCAVEMFVGANVPTFVRATAARACVNSPLKWDPGRQPEARRLLLRTRVITAMAKPGEPDKKRSWWDSLASFFDSSRGRSRGSERSENAGPSADAQSSSVQDSTGPASSGPTYSANVASPPLKGFEPADWMKEFAEELGPVYDETPVSQKELEAAAAEFASGEGFDPLETPEEDVSKGWEMWQAALKRNANAEETEEGAARERDKKAEVDVWRSTARELGSTDGSTSAPHDDAGGDLGGIENFPNVEDILGNGAQAPSQEGLWEIARDITRESADMQERLKDEVENYNPESESELYRDAARDILDQRQQQLNVSKSESLNEEAVPLEDSTQQDLQSLASGSLETPEDEVAAGWALWQNALVREVEEEEAGGPATRDFKAEVDKWRSAARDLGSTGASSAEFARPDDPAADERPKIRDQRQDEKEELGGVENFPDVESILGAQPEVSPPSQWNPDRDWARFDDQARAKQLEVEKERRAEIREALSRELEGGSFSAEEALSPDTSKGFQYVDARGKTWTVQDVVEQYGGKMQDGKNENAERQSFQDGPKDDDLLPDDEPSLTSQDVLKDLVEDASIQGSEDEDDSAGAGPSSEQPDQVRSFLSKLASRRGGGSTYGSDAVLGDLDEDIPMRDPAMESQYWLNSAREIVGSKDNEQSSGDASSPQGLSSTASEEESRSAWDAWSSASEKWGQAVAESRPERDLKAEVNKWRTSAREVSSECTSSDVSSSGGASAGGGVNNAGAGSSDWGTGLDPNPMASERSAWETWSASNPVSGSSGTNLWFENRADYAASRGGKTDVSEAAQPSFWRDVAREVGSNSTEQASSSSAGSNIEFWRDAARDLGTPSRADPSSDSD
ncbi:hypothetical protein FVE85_7132 [Porphyridium purpureum]|uniref:Uncharacterized protein n=1 Tax=Porphyridium purpureum TaxID=35688 RepID=A0A5J4ZA92_PORPP|nr:hypothetical protein FVE85_7132 [Porphyridium purpureum]|eukprot:POR7722..scf295_1